MPGNHAAHKLLGQRKAKAKEKKSTLMDKDSDDEDEGWLGTLYRYNPFARLPALCDDVYFNVILEVVHLLTYSVFKITCFIAIKDIITSMMITDIIDLLFSIRFDENHNVWTVFTDRQTANYKLPLLYSFMQ